MMTPTNFRSKDSRIVSVIFITESGLADKMVKSYISVIGGEGIRPGYIPIGIFISPD